MSVDKLRESENTSQYNNTTVPIFITILLSDSKIGDN